ncbi:hypothetical protein EDC01DRAFT_626649 [Geopyxis carbonaria]|nr:hypothetical protein EDC01DRAFT_626649 [Geopyxis carbonaria]
MSYLILADTRSDMTVLDALRFIQGADKNGPVNAFIGYRKIVGSLPKTSKIETTVTVVEGLRTPIFDGCKGDFAVGLHAAVTDVLRVTLCCPTSIQESRSHILLQHVMAGLQYMLSHNPEEITVDSLNLLSDDENRVVHNFSRPFRGPQPDLIHVLFEHQVTQAPDAIAIQFEDEETMTFAQLNRLANRIAQSFGGNYAGAIIPLAGGFCSPADYPGGQRTTCWPASDSNNFSRNHQKPCISTCWPISLYHLLATLLKNKVLRIHIFIPWGSCLNGLVNSGKGVRQATGWSTGRLVGERISTLILWADWVTQDICPCVPGQVELLTRGRTNSQFWQLQTVRSLPKELNFDKWQHGDEWLQVTLKDAVLDLDVVECASEDEKSQIINANWEKPFEIGKPAVRYRLLLLPDGSRDILIKLDHASYDGTPLRIFDDQFQAISKGVEPPRHVDFLNFTRWVRHTNKSRALDFWSQYLSGAEFPKPLASQPATNSVLVPGRNIGMEDADMINGTVANFLPFRSKADRNTVTVQQILKETQNLFWKTNENGVIGMQDIFAKLNWTREKNSSRYLFLFQPFEPTVGPVEHMRWLVMALSHTIKMPVDYAIMLEVFKTPVGYNVRIKYDNRVYSKIEAESIGDDFLRLMVVMMNNPRSIVGKLYRSKSRCSKPSSDEYPDALADPSDPRSSFLKLTLRLTAAAAVFCEQRRKQQFKKNAVIIPDKSKPP